MKSEPINFEQRMIAEWRELGFYYDQDERTAVNQWRFYGSKYGLQNFIQLLDTYIADPRKGSMSEHEHYGPYSYFKLMTWDKAVITENYIAGTIQDLKELRDLIAEKTVRIKPGQTFNVDEEYGVSNTITAKFFCMSDDFDPASMDELIVSGRQKYVNEEMK